MKKLAIVLLIAGSLLISSCVELALLAGGVAVGGAAGYYAGKEGYKVKVEKEEK